MCAAQSTTHTHTLITPAPAPALADNLARCITVANLPERGGEPCSDKVSFLGNLLSVCSHAACAGRGQQQQCRNNAQHSGCRWPSQEKRQQNCYGDNDNDNAPAMAKALLPLLLLLHT